MDAVKMSRPLATRLLFEAQKQPGVEVCGFVSARAGVAREVYPVANIAADPARRFEMDPGEHIHAFKTMRERGETLLAIYHSHPNSPPEPSVHDIDGLGYPEALVLIVSLDIKGVLEMRAWRPSDQRMQAIEIAVMD